MLRFGVFCLDTKTHELYRSGRPLPLAQQPARVLELLARRSGEVVSREELRHHIWGDQTYVDFERGLNFCVSQVRRALGDDARAPRWIQTVPRVGYRFLAAVEQGDDIEQPRLTTTFPETKPEEVRAAPRVAAAEWVGAPAHTGPADRDRLPRRAWVLGALSVPILFGLSWLLTAGWGSSSSTTALATAEPTRSAGALRLRLAVLPFADLSQDAAEARSYFSEGLTEELIAQLGALDPQRLGVIARASVQRYAPRSQDLSTAASELEVAFLLVGTVRREDERVRITSQLVRAADQTPLWSQTFDHNRWGALIIQREVGVQVARALELRLLAREDLPDRAGSHDLEAHDAYFRGRYLQAKGTLADLLYARTAYRLAIAEDPAFALPRAALATVSHLLARRGAMPASEAYSEAEAAARMALELAPELAESHVAISLTQLWRDCEPEAAAQALDRALRLNPSLPLAHRQLGWSLLVAGRPEAASEAMARARQLDPLSPEARLDEAWGHYYSGRFAAAAQSCQRVLELEPRLLAAQLCRERALILDGQEELARRALADRLGVATELDLQQLLQLSLQQL